MCLLAHSCECCSTDLTPLQVRCESRGIRDMQDQGRDGQSNSEYNSYVCRRGHVHVPSKKAICQERGYSSPHWLSHTKPHQAFFYMSTYPLREEKGDGGLTVNAGSSLDCWLLVNAILGITQTSSTNAFIPIVKMELCFSRSLSWIIYGFSQDECTAFPPRFCTAFS